MSFDKSKSDQSPGAVSSRAVGDSPFTVSNSTDSTSAEMLNFADLEPCKSPDEAFARIQVLEDIQKQTEKKASESEK